MASTVVGGIWLVSSVPLPASPSLLEPQHCTCPFTNRAQEWKPLALTCVAPLRAASVGAWASTRVAGRRGEEPGHRGAQDDAAEGHGKG